MKGFPKFISLLLAALLLTASLAACSDAGSGEVTTAGGNNTAAADTTAEAVVTVPLDEYGREIIPDNLPEVNLGGREFSVHTRGNVEQYEWLAPEQNGQILNDAIYKRNTNVENRLGIRLNVIAEGDWSDYSSTTLPKIKASIQAGNGAYDLIAGFSTPISSMATTGFIYDLNDLQYLNFEQPWWNQSIRDELSVDGTTYFGVGSLSTSMLYSLMCIFVNTDILSEIAEVGYNIYDQVNNGKWTFDELLNMSKRAYNDTNGNGTIDDKDRIGFATTDTNNTNSTIGFYYATGLKLMTRDDNGTPILDVNVERTTEVIDKLRVLLYTGEGVLPADKNPDFTSGNILFFFHWLYGGQTKYAGAMDNYGVVPLPKYNEEQERYYSTVQSGMHMYCVPIDVKDPQDVGLITEALASESYKVLQPAYYEVVLKTRYAKDSQTSQMVDLMYNTIVFDFANIYNGTLGIMSAVQNNVKSETNSFSAVYKATQKTAQKQLDDLIETIRNSKKG